MSWDRSLIGRAGYYIRIAVNPQNADDVLVAEQQLLALERRRRSRSQRPRRRRRLRRLPRLWMDPKDGRRFVLTDDGGARITSRRTATRRCACRTARCITSPPTTACRTGSTAIGRTTARCAGRAPCRSRPATACCPRLDDDRVRRVAVGDAAAAGAAALRGVAGRGARRRPRPGRPVSAAASPGFTLPGSRDPNIVWATLLRQQGDALGRAQRDRARSVESVDATRSIRSRTRRSTAATGRRRSRSIRSIRNTVLLRLPGDLQDVQRRPDVEVISPDLSTKDPVAHRLVRRHRRRQPRPVLRRGRVRHRAVADPEGPALGRHQRRQALVHADGGGKWTDVTKNITGMPPWGTVSQIAPSNFDPARRTSRRLPPDGRPRAVHLQDDRLRRRRGRRISDGLPHDHPLAT